LYRRIYEQEPEVTNCEITLGFARGLIRESKTHDVNWANFAVRCREKREKTAAKKAENAKLAKQSEGDGEGPKGRNGVGTVGLKRACSLNKENIPPLKLVKVEQPSMPKGRLGVRGATAPNWGEEELLDMEVCLSKRSELLKKLKVSLGEFASKKTAVESDFRRSTLECSDREVLLAQSRVAIENSKAEADTLKLQIEGFLLQSKQTASLDAKEINESVEASLHSLQARHERLLFKISIDERTEKHHREMLESCKSQNFELEKLFLECSSQSSEISGKVECLEKVLVDMGNQWEKMNDGSGVVAFPRPISMDPESPVRTVTNLNPCPICKLWYSCYNHQFATCGHTYHPWCLAEYTKTAVSCAVPCCKGPFSSVDWLAALDFRPTIADVTL
jgi:hypothetical protein